MVDPRQVFRAGVNRAVLSSIGDAARLRRLVHKQDLEGLRAELTELGLWDPDDPNFDPWEEATYWADLFASSAVRMAGGEG